MIEIIVKADYPYKNMEPSLWTGRKKDNERTFKEQQGMGFHSENYSIMYYPKPGYSAQNVFASEYYEE